MLPLRVNITKPCMEGLLSQIQLRKTLTRYENICISSLSLYIRVYRSIWLYNFRLLAHISISVYLSSYLFINLFVALYYICPYNCLFIFLYFNWYIYICSIHIFYSFCVLMSILNLQMFLHRSILILLSTCFV